MPSKRRPVFFTLTAFRRLIVLAVLEVAISLMLPNHLVAQTANQNGPKSSGSVSSVSVKRINADRQLNQLITKLVLKHIPHSYSKDKDWGRQRERFDGIKFRREGWRIETKRRKKKVNHGTWRKYSAELEDPQRQFAVGISNIRQTRDENLALRVQFVSRLKLFARQAEWVKGVQLYSLSAEGKARVRLNIDMELDIKVDPTVFPPALVFFPRATAADLIVEDLRIDRVSKLGGEFAQQVTRAARDALEDEIKEKEAELVVKINKELDKNADDLRLSLADAISSEWTEPTLPFLPPAVRGLLDGDN